MSSSRLNSFPRLQAECQHLSAWYSLPMPRGNGAQDSELNERARALLEAVRSRVGRITNASRLRAHHTELLEHAIGLDKFVGASVLVPLHLKELAQIKVAALVGCPF